LTLHLIIWTTLLLLIASCSRGTPATAIPPTLLASPTDDLGNLSPDDVATLRSLEQLHDYPFYVMHYSGDYDYPQTSLSLSGRADFSCSLFAALDDSGDMLYGRNFDWDFSPTLLLFTDPADGYSSASMVDLTFLGISPVSSRMLTDLPLTERTELLSAPSMPFDGMNEYGLTVGMAAVPDVTLDDASYDPSRSTIGSIGIIRQVLDHARDVDEALRIFSEYNVDFAGGPPIHYLIADPGGKAVLIEYFQGEMLQLPNDNPWHLATNHLRCIAEGDGGCNRYRTILERLTASNGQLDMPAAMQLLSEVRQGMTQWSSVYNMSSGEINVAIARDYDTLFSFGLDLLHP